MRSPAKHALNPLRPCASEGRRATRNGGMPRLALAGGEHEQHQRRRARAPMAVVTTYSGIGHAQQPRTSVHALGELGERRQRMKKEC